MPLFGRRTNAATKESPGYQNGSQGGRGVPFSFGRWLRLHGVDIVTMALMGALGLGVYFASMFSNHLNRQTR